MERAGGGKYVTRESGRLPPPGAGLVHTHTHTHTNQPTSKVVPIVNLLLDAKEKKNDKATNWASQVDGGTPVSVCGYRSLFEYIVHADVRRQNTPSRRDEKIGLLSLSLSLLSSFTNAGHDRVQGYILQSPRGACHMAKVSATAARYHRSIAWSRQRNRNQALYAHVTHAQKKVQSSQMSHTQVAMKKKKK